MGLQFQYGHGSDGGEALQSVPRPKPVRLRHWQEERRLQKTLNLIYPKAYRPNYEPYTLRIKNLPDLLTRPEDRTSKTRAFRSSFGST